MLASRSAKQDWPNTDDDHSWAYRSRERERDSVGLRPRITNGRIDVAVIARRIGTCGCARGGRWAAGLGGAAVGDDGVAALMRIEQGGAAITSAD